MSVAGGSVTEIRLNVTHDSTRTEKTERSRDLRPEEDWRGLGRREDTTQEVSGLGCRDAKPD